MQAITRKIKALAAFYQTRHDFHEVARPMTVIQLPA
jgi:hypothetical protein